MPVLKDASKSFRRPLHWRMNHRGQEALRDGDWKYLKVDGNEYLFNIPGDERERANLAKKEPDTSTDSRMDGRETPSATRRESQSSPVVGYLNLAAKMGPSL